MLKATEGFWAAGLLPTIKLQQHYSQDRTIQIAIVISPNWGIHFTCVCVSVRVWGGDKLFAGWLSPPHENKPHKEQAWLMVQI